MAHEKVNNTNPNIVRINQLLHGYDAGHHLLAGSIKPDKQSAKTLLAFSDLSGGGMLPGTMGYLTGYPLPQMNAYAFARTWLAPELSRPGCVWTHTLLIDFADLAIIRNMSLLTLFRRPSNLENKLIYDQPLSIENGSRELNNEVIPLNVIITIIEAIYKSPEDSVTVYSQKDIPIEKIVMALWLQQWPKLRRNFRFCTWAPSDRSRKGERFDLQFTPEKRYSYRVKQGINEGLWVDLRVPSPSSLEDWVTVVAKDAISRDHSSVLRQFYWRYGSEVESNRAALKPLTLICQALESNSKVDLPTAIVAIESIQPAIPGLTQRVMQKIIELSHQTTVIPDVVIKFLIQNLSFLDRQTTTDSISKIADIIWKNAPNSIWPLFHSKSTVEQSIATMAAKFMKPTEAFIGADGDVDLFCAALKANPHLAASSLVWDAPAPFPTRAANILISQNNKDKSTLYAMLEAVGEDVSKFGFDTFGQSAINAAIEYFESDNTQKHYRAKQWLVAAKQYPNYLLTAVAQGIVHKIKTLALIASLVSYHTPPVSPSGRDEWAHALTFIQGNLSGDTAFSFYAFLLGRALSGSSPEPGPLICASFDKIHNDLLRSRSEKNAWAKLERELPEVSWWNNWDRAQRVRLGVIEACIDAQVSPKYFLEITKSDKVFKKLVDIAIFSLKGREYLKSVSSWAGESNIENTYNRRKLIATSLRRY